MNRKTMLQKAQELAQLEQATRALEDESKKDGSSPSVPVEYKQGRPQINEPMALCTGLIDKAPKGPKSIETGSSPTRQKQILQQAVRKIGRQPVSQHDDLDLTQ